MDEAYPVHYFIHERNKANGLASFDSWLLLRGLKTLHIRMERHNENAMKVAHWLRKQEKVTKVFYVGFEDHPGYEVTKKQTKGFGGMISFNVDSVSNVLPQEIQVTLHVWYAG